VREFGLFSTTFRRVDGQEIIAPNALLASAKLVHNLRRSKSMCATQSPIQSSLLTFFFFKVGINQPNGVV